MRELDHAAEWDRYCEQERGFCGVCRREGRVATALWEKRLCDCGSVICRRCWDCGDRECLKCLDRREQQCGE